MRQIYIESYFRSGYSRFTQLIEDIVDHPCRKDIERRLEIINFFDKWGPAATRQAFKKSRATIYPWKNKLKRSKRKLSSLAPGNKTPIHRRKRIPRYLFPLPHQLK